MPGCVSFLAASVQAARLHGLRAIKELLHPRDAPNNEHFLLMDAFMESFPGAPEPSPLAIHDTWRTHTATALLYPSSAVLRNVGMSLSKAEGALQVHHVLPCGPSEAYRHPPPCITHVEGWLRGCCSPISAVLGRASCPSRKLRVCCRHSRVAVPNPQVCWTTCTTFQTLMMRSKGKSGLQLVMLSMLLHCC